MIDLHAGPHLDVLNLLLMHTKKSLFVGVQCIGTNTSCRKFCHADPSLALASLSCCAPFHIVLATAEHIDTELAHSFPVR